jgi:alanine transaminase
VTVDAGQKLYIHCWGGGGLTGVVGACLLGKLYGVSQEEATERVRWAFVLRQGPEGSKALSNQRDLDFVQEYFQSLQ